MKANYDIVEEIIKNGKKISILKNKEKKYLLKKQVVYSSDILTISSLKNEVTCLFMLKETNIVPKIIEYNFDVKEPYLITEFISYNRLYDVTFSSLKQKIMCMINILYSVNKIHEKGIIHCDLKPQNILINENFDIKIIDFDISFIKNKDNKVYYGSFNYCSPEQLERKNLNEQSDIYSLGIILYRLITGRLPFERNYLNLKESIDYSKIEKIADKKLNQIVFRAIEKDLTKRYRNTEEFMKELKIYLKKGEDIMNEKFKRYLPIGSVVLLKDAKKKVMIIGYAVTSPEHGERVFDYIGCLFPEGVISPTKNLLFDHKDVNQIFAIGYSDDEQKEFSKRLDEATKIREEKVKEELEANVDNSNQ